ncbi:MAG: septum formation initiator family protein [Desulfocapsa sp.]|nr:septum formation initiator family protein [Desulfocapsa sp.]
MRVAFAIVGLSLLWLFFAPGSGLFHLLQKKKNLATLIAEQDILVQQNQEIERDIRRLQDDEAYLEQIAREDHGMLKDNEMVFDFSREKKGKK